MESPMATTDVKLLGTWVCPYVNRAQLALNLKSVDHDFLDGLHFKKREMLDKYNPVHKKVPVLVHGDESISESLIIVQYIDDAWPNGPSILPSDPYDRALARFWTAYIDDKWFPLVKVLREAEDEEEKTEVLHKVSKGLALIEEAFIKMSNGKPFFGGDNIGYVDIVLGGDNIGYVDIVLGSCLGWLGVTEKVVEVKLLEEAKTPELAKWADRLCSHDAVKDVLPESWKLLEFYKKILPLVKAT